MAMTLTTDFFSSQYAWVVLVQPSISPSTQDPSSSSMTNKLMRDVIPEVLLVIPSFASSPTNHCTKEGTHEISAGLCTKAKHLHFKVPNSVHNFRIISSTMETFTHDKTGIAPFARSMPALIRI